MSKRLVALADAQADWPWAQPRYLRRCVAERRIPFKKIAGRIWFDAAELDRHEQDGVVEPPTARLLRSVRSRSRRSA